MKRKAFKRLAVLLLFPIMMMFAPLHPEASEDNSAAGKDFVPIRAGPKTENDRSVHERISKNDEEAIWTTDGNKKENQAGKKEGLTPRLREETDNGDSEQNPEDAPESSSVKQEGEGGKEDSKSIGDGKRRTGKASGGANGKRHGIVSAGKLLVRSGPGMHYEPVGSLQHNASVTVLSFQNDWAEIVFHTGTAWINTRYVRFPGDTDKEEQNGDVERKEENGAMKAETENGADADTPDKGMVDAPALNVRDSASLNGNIIGTVSRGEIFAVLEEKNGWLKIEFEDNCFGWISGTYVNLFREMRTEKEDGEQHPQKTADKTTSGTILYNGTRIREQPHLKSRILQTAHAGETYSIVRTVGDWKEILLETGQKAYVAGWLIKDAEGNRSAKEKENNRSLSGKVIIIDPGHGGKDSGAIGAGGSEEKTLTLNTALILYDKLRAEGARVILTRNSDIFVPLPSRVDLSRIYEADAFISIHYDSHTTANAGGITSYYYHVYQKPLADHIHDALQKQIGLRNRGVRLGDYYVIRENHQAAVLLELGFISNPHEEAYISSRSYQEEISEAIVAGLGSYFSS